MVKIIFEVAIIDVELSSIIIFYVSYKRLNYTNAMKNLYIFSVYNLNRKA